MTTNPRGIDCGATCTANLPRGTVVTLAANPAAGSNFTGFTGAGCAGSGTTCVVAMTEARSVTATFGIARVRLSRFAR